MSRVVDLDSPITGFKATYSILIALAAVIFVVVGIFALYQFELLLSPSERTWKTHEAGTHAAGLPLVGDDTVVTLQRDTCWEGPCPIYVVSVFGSGLVSFRGQAYVCEKAPAGYYVDRVAVTNLVAGLNAAGFKSMRNYVNLNLTDSPTVAITLKEGGSEHTVVHYHGDRSAPRLLTWMEQRIDVVAATEPWVGRDGGRCDS